MKTVCLNILVMLLSIVCLTACHDEPQFADTPTGNFEALWSALDRHYCFFQYKTLTGRRCTTDMPQNQQQHDP